MPAIDDLINSNLVSEIEAKLGASASSGRKIIIPFEALELAAEITAGTEATISELMAQLATAKSWIIKIYFSERKVEFSD